MVEKMGAMEQDRSHGPLSVRPLFRRICLGFSAQGISFTAADEALALCPRRASAANRPRDGLTTRVPARRRGRVQRTRHRQQSTDSAPPQAAKPRSRFFYFCLLYFLAYANKPFLFFCLSPFPPWRLLLLVSPRPCQDAELICVTPPCDNERVRPLTS